MTDERTWTKYFMVSGNSGEICATMEVEDGTIGEQPSCCYGCSNYGGCYSITIEEYEKRNQK